ncbi:MAG TPA: serine hydrolase domain-containing protein [Bradyrhizobium sp.]|nr:serine hydrolase domain-containing protein [Bradyrhizobium sp.]
MADELRGACNGILQKVVTGQPRVPGVVAMITSKAANIYEGAAGERVLGGPAMTADTVFAIFSTTKAITGTAILQCVEEGLLDLDAPAKTYIPEIGQLQVLEGFDASGNPKLRAPKRDITTRMLMLHTAGLGYDFFNANYFRLAQERGQPSVVTCSRASLMTPLLFDPGDKWEYGSNIDWCGQIVERIRGKRLGEVMKERIFEPLGMQDIAFSLTPEMRSRLAVIHQRGADGSLTPLPDLQLPSDPEVHMGGHGLYASIGEYMKFIRMWLNDGAGPDGRVLKKETVETAVRNGLEAHQNVVMLPGVIATLSNDAEFFPGLKKSWSYTFMVNDEDAPTGRPAGSIGWAGLANTFYWIDRKNGFGGYWATQILPFGDPVSFGGYLEFETAAYATSEARAAA